MSTPDPWCGLEFGDPAAPKRQLPLSSRSSVQQALSAGDGPALEAALSALNPCSRRPAELARQLAATFSPACAQVLFDQGLIAPRTTFDLAVAAQDTPHIAWWLASKDRIDKLNEESSSLRYQRAHPKQSTYAWISGFLMEWAQHHPQEFIQITKTAHWPSIRVGHGYDGFPVRMMSIALKDEGVAAQDVRAVLERALDPACVFWMVSSTSGPIQDKDISQARAKAMTALRAELLSASPAIAGRLQEVVSGSPLLSEAWGAYWRLTDLGGWRRRIAIAYPQSSYSFDVTPNTLLEDQLAHAAPAIVSLLSKDDMGKPSASSQAAFQCLAQRPDILSAFTAKLSPEAAPMLLSRLAPHLAEIRCKGENGKPFSYAQLCLSRVATLTMFNALARNAQTASQLLVPDATTGVTPTDEFLKKARLTASQKEQVEKAVARGRRARLGKLAADTVTEERSTAPRRTM